MAGSRMMFTLPLLLVLVTAIQAELQCYQCQDCEAKEKYKDTAMSCPGPANTPATALPPTLPTTTIPTTTKPATPAPANNFTSDSENNIKPAPENNIKPAPENNTTSANINNTIPTTINNTIPTTINNTIPTTINNTIPTNLNNTHNIINISTDPINNNTSSGNHNGTDTTLRRRKRSDDFDKIPKCFTLTYTTVDNVTKTDRGCSYEKSDFTNDKICLTILGKDRTQKNCTVCEGDKCNSATKLTVALLPLVIGLSLFINH